jgi:hypothetical protein
MQILMICITDPEEAEIDSSVIPMLEKELMFCEAHIPGVLQDEKT